MNKQNNKIENTDELLEDIKYIKENIYKSYSKHSGYSVSAVLKTKENKKYFGVNIENNGIQSYCAERVAFLKAISEGEKNFEYILVMGKENENLNESKNINSNINEENNVFLKTMPCGYCRQFMSEFVDEKFKIYIVYETNENNNDDNYNYKNDNNKKLIVEEYKMSELLPNNFKI